MSVLLYIESQRATEAKAIMITVINYACMVSKAEWKEKNGEPI